MSRGWVHLHDTSGAEIWVRPEHVSAVTATSNADKARIHLVGGENLVVRGTPNQVRSRLSQ